MVLATLRTLAAPKATVLSEKMCVKEVRLFPSALK
jgi:hypothetical protein